MIPINHQLWKKLKQQLFRTKRGHLRGSELSVFSAQPHDGALQATFGPTWFNAVYRVFRWTKLHQEIFKQGAELSLVLLCHLHVLSWQRVTLHPSPILEIFMVYSINKATLQLRTVKIPEGLLLAWPLFSSLSHNHVNN